MDRPTRGPQNPTDPHVNAGDRGAPRPVVADPWADALNALQSLAQTPAAGAPPTSDPRRSTPVGLPQIHIDEALDALQALASRHRAQAGAAPAPEPVDDDPFPRRTMAPAPPRTASFDPTAHAAAAAEPAWADEHGEAAPRRWSRWGSPALIVVSAAVLAVLLVGAVSLSRQLFHREPSPVGDTAAPTASAAAPVLVRMTKADGTTDLPAVEKSMSDCDDEAARNQDGLYFLILPLLSPVKNYQPWVAASVGEIGTSVILLRSKDALDGLRDGSLSLYRGAYTFSIIDATTEASHAWTPATGVAKFTKVDAAQMAGFRVRFGFADFVGDTPSNFRFPRQKGVCYWVSALLRE
jgi:hypothetical protein